MDILEGGVRAWALREDADYGVITGDSSNIQAEALRRCYGYSADEVELILALREAAKKRGGSIAQQSTENGN